MTKNPKKLPKTSPAPFDPPQWPAAKVEMWNLAKIIPYPRNARTHPKEQISMLAGMMTRHGVDQPIVVDEAGVILKGHGRRLGAIEAGFEEFPVVQHFGISETDKIAMRLQDNQLSLLSGWDSMLIRGEMKSLELSGYDMPLLGFPKIELVGFMTGLNGETLSEDDADRAKLLELISVTIDDPRHKVEIGDRFTLKKKHNLFCVGVIDDWSVWSPMLIGDALFCPYPGVFVPFGTKAKTHSLVMVQPDPYIAGHILDRFEEVNGPKSIVKVTK